MAINTDALIVDGGGSYSRRSETFYVEASQSPILSIATDIPTPSLYIGDQSIPPAFVAYAGTDSTIYAYTYYTAVTAMTGISWVAASDSTMTVVSKDVTPSRLGNSTFFIGKNITEFQNNSAVGLSIDGPSFYAPNSGYRKLILEGNFKFGDTCNIKDKDDVPVIQNGEKVQ